MHVRTTLPWPGYDQTAPLHRQESARLPFKKFSSCQKTIFIKYLLYSSNIEHQQPTTSLSSYSIAVKGACLLAFEIVHIYKYVDPMRRKGIYWRLIQPLEICWIKQTIVLISTSET